MHSHAERGNDQVWGGLGAACEAASYWDGSHAERGNDRVWGELDAVREAVSY